MLGQNCYTYVKIGLAIRLLMNVNASVTKEIVSSTLELLTEGLQEGNFEVTLAAMNSVDYANMMKDVEAITDEDQAIGEQLATVIEREIGRIEHVVFPEASIKKTYVLPSRRYNTDWLMNHPEKLLAEGIFEKLDELARHDISSACRCLLFGEATAAAFHILRATESVLRTYYCHHRKRNRLSEPMWANMVDQLKAKTRNRPPATLLDSLDLIRTAYRNPTQHPEATYEIDGAQDLFGVCLDVIGKMGSEI